MNLQITMVHALCGVLYVDVPHTNTLFPIIHRENEKVAPVTHAL